MTGIDLPEREACYERLRSARFDGSPACVHCGDGNVIRKGTTERGAQRYFCKACETFFNDLTGTVFAHRHLPVEELCYVVAEMDSTSTAQIARDLDRNYEQLLAFVHAVREALDGDDPVVSAVCDAEGPPRPSDEGTPASS